MSRRWWPPRLEGKRLKLNSIIEKLDQMEGKYDAFITAILASDEEVNGEEDNAEKESLDVAAEGKEAGTPSNPIALDTEAKE